MTVCLLIRHGQSQANVDGILAGHLDSALTEQGVNQARLLASGLRPVPIRRIISSPLRRCMATAEELGAQHPDAGPIAVEDRIAEVHYGAWTGRSLKELAAEDLWTTIQHAPSTVTFPASSEHPHESMTAVSDRAWTAWTEWEAQIAAEHGDPAVWALVSHGDVIKALLARALGLQLDRFQSIVIDPASVSIVLRAGERTAVTGMNLRDDALERLAHDPSQSTSAGAVGGGDA